MPDQVVTELVIDADTSGADRFSQAMSGAEQSVTGMNAGLLALGAGTVAAMAGFKLLMDHVVSANKDLADMQTVARQVGLSIADFQGVKLGGEIAGLTDGQINQGLERSAYLLNDAQRNANSLSKELDANGISIKNSNGQLISENQLLGIAADLIKKAASPGDQLAIAQMLGFTKEWIPLLQQGSGAMAGLTDEAKKAGAVIDDETVKRASEFDDQWRKSSALFSANMKASLVALLPYVDDLIDGANRFIKSIDLAKAAQATDEHVKDVLKPGEDALKEAGIGGIKIGITPETTQALQDFINAPFFSDEFWASAGRAFSNAVKIIDPNETKWYAGAPAVTDYSNAQQTAQWQAFGASWKSSQSGYLDGADKNGPASKVAGKDEADDAYDRAIAQVEKHTARTIADAEAVGKGAGAQEELRAQYQLMLAAEQAGLPITQAMRDKIQDLAQDAGDAAQALAKIKVASDIAFSRNTAGLSQTDVQIASQLRNIYPDVAEALNSAEAAQIRFNTAARGVSSSIESSLVSGLTDITTGAKSAGQGFTDMSNAIIKAIEQMIIKITIVEPLMRGLQGALGGFGIGAGGSAPLPGQASFIGPVASAQGNVFGSGNVIPFAQGGVVDGPHVAPMALFGEAGPEAIVPLRRGADGNLGVASSGGGGKAPNIIINNHTDAQPQVSQASNGDISITLKKIVDSAVGDSLSSGTGMRVLNKQYGVKQFAGQ